MTFLMYVAGQGIARGCSLEASWGGAKRIMCGLLPTSCPLLASAVTWAPRPGHLKPSTGQGQSYCGHELELQRMLKAGKSVESIRQRLAELSCHGPMLRDSIMSVCCCTSLIQAEQASQLEHPAGREQPISTHCLGPCCCSLASSWCQTGSLP